MGSTAGILDRLESFCTASNENNIGASLVEPDKMRLELQAFGTYSGEENSSGLYGWNDE